MLRPSILLVSLIVLFAATTGCFGPSGSDDPDDDGLNDATEALVRTITVQRREGAVELRVSSDGASRDGDRDGLDDLNEYARGTDPRDADTDRDGLLDGPNQSIDPDSPLADEWRTRGILEAPRGTFWGELSFCPRISGLRPNDWTSDRPLRDQLSDGEELLGWQITVRGETRQVASDPCTPDTDGDGLPDHLERKFGSDPTLRNTDGDADLDGTDVDPLWDIWLRFANVTVYDTNRSVRISFDNVDAVVSATRSDTAELDASESVAPDDPRTSFVFHVILDSVDARTGEDVDVRGPVAVLDVDLMQRKMTIGAQTFPEGTIRTTGPAGSLTFDWSVVRR